MEHLYKIYPKNDISGILPGNKRILDPVVMPLNRKEFIKCMNAGDVYAIVNGQEIFISELDYDKAESLFDIKNNNQKEPENNDVNLNNTEHKDKYQNDQINQSSSKRNNKRNRRYNN